MNGIIPVAVIGGGASGLTAGISAAYSGKKPVIFERNERVGKKILVTGNGKCNLTNNSIDLRHFHGIRPDFAVSALRQFDLKNTLDFFEKIGLEFMTDGEGRIFPSSLQAGSVLDCLRFELEKAGTGIYTNSEVAAIEKLKKTFQIKTPDGRFYETAAVVLSCGGRAAPSTGSDGAGFNLAGSLGHSIITPSPALVQLRLAGSLYKAMEGMKWNCAVRLLINEKVTDTAQGDILFTNYGISGSAVLALSRNALIELRKKNSAALEIDFFPGLSLSEKSNIIEKRINNQPERTLEHFFTGWLNKRIGQSVLKSAGLTYGRTYKSLTDVERNSIARTLHSMRFEITGDTGWPNAQATAGGVDTSEIDEKTLESRIVKGLFFSGEIIDIDGDSGGYNLQWAWSSGFTAGKSAALYSSGAVKE